VPNAQFVQPSVLDIAEKLVEYCPAGHSCVSQVVLDPVPDHLPAPQSVHPSVADVAAILVEYCPAGHC